MLAHYLIAAFASFRRARLATLVSILTLALGLVCFVVAYGVVGFWDRAEQHFENADRTFVVTSSWRFRGNDAVGVAAVPQSNVWIAQYLRADFPKIETTARAARLVTDLWVRGENRTERFAAYGADPDFLRIFDLPFVSGSATDALRNPGSVVLTREAARRLYGRDDPIGEPIVLDNAWNGTVTGVIDRIPEPSHMGRSAAAPMRFDLLASWDFLESSLPGMVGPRAAEDWGFVPPSVTYVLLPADRSLDARFLREQLPAFTARHMPKE
jgi:putative ABC transport system permease protein